MPAPDTATDARRRFADVFPNMANEMRAVVPVESVTLGLVPGEPLRVAVYVVAVVVPTFVV
jgi:hypothetical protein